MDLKIKNKTVKSKAMNILTFDVEEWYHFDIYSPEALLSKEIFSDMI